MGHSNISVFVPHIGCPHMCAFCNQRTITGTEKIPHADDVKRICTQAMNEVKDVSQTEIAFFGGSFTAVPREYMLELLGAAQEFIGNDKFKGIRISTRPDYISTEILDILRDNHVTAIELGAQSMSDVVLKANERGHTVQDVENAAKLIKSYGCFDLGLQMMIGLYKSNREAELETWPKIAALSPKTVRIYPVVILNGTRLGELYKSGEYKPMDFDEVVKICSYLLTEADKLGIDVIKLGLHASEVVEEQMLGGFYHPAFRELCEGRNYRRLIAEELGKHGNISDIASVVISVPKRQISKAIGQKKANIEYFKDLGVNIKIVGHEDSDKIKINEIIMRGGEK